MNANERKQIMADEIAKWPRDEILARLRHHEVPSAPLLRRQELMGNDQIIASGSVVRTHYEGFGEVRQASPAARFSRTPGSIQGPAPSLGQHTMDILAELGLSEDERAALVEQGVVKTG